MTGPRATYLDWNATSPILPEAAAAMAAALAACGNPSSVHRWGRAARTRVEAARREVAALAGAAEDEVIFTSGGSEANQTALRGFPGRRILVSALEHDSVRAGVPDCDVVPALPSGQVDLGALERMLASDERPALVSLMLANNETGAIQPVPEAAGVAHARGAILHCDAVQAAGRIPLDKAALGADLLALSAHKIGGPQGAGALIASPDLPLVPLIAGGGQERGRRAGTENVAAIAGFGAAARAARARVADQSRIAALRDGAERRLLEIAPEARIFGGGGSRLANTLAVSMPGVPAATQVMALDLAGVMVSAGSACSSGKVRPSAVLAAMGVRAEDSECAIRISLGWSSTAADIDHLVEAWGALYARTRAHAA